MHQHNSHKLIQGWIETAEIFLHEVRQLSAEFTASGSTTNHCKGKQLAFLRIRDTRDVSGLEAFRDSSPDPSCILNPLQKEAVLMDTRYTERTGLHSDGHDEHVVLQSELRPQTRGERPYPNLMGFSIDFLTSSLHEAHARVGGPDVFHDRPILDSSHRGGCQHWREDEVVPGRDNHHLAGSLINDLAHSMCSPACSEDHDPLPVQRAAHQIWIHSTRGLRTSP
mmetsp:Transcript_8466/g.13413  ORF Transcript_8466/g.13413 Transcript_8466/m.13413 type:complete len:224 (-) Transcript_8466:442-1113(-)